MPKMSDTMEEGTISSWQVSVGDEISSGDLLAEIETDKATMELESFWDGHLLYIGPKEQDSVPVDDVIAIIGEQDENVDDLVKSIEKGEDPGNGSGSGDEMPSPDVGAVSEGDSGSSDDAGSDVDVSDIPATVIRMPKMSDTMEEGTIVSWNVKVGEEVSSGDLMAEVETDKATMELESFEDGNILYIGVDEGEAVPVDSVIAIVGEEGADYEALLKAEKSGGTSSGASEEKKEETPAAASSSGTTGGASSTDTGRIKASPLAKKMAEEKGYDLNKIKGTGEGGRIVKRDIESYEPAKEAAPAKEEKTEQAAPSTGRIMPTMEESYDEIKVSNMRKTIAKRLSESKYNAPHFYVTMEINMTKMWGARKQMNEISPVKISFNDIVIKACSMALRQHPAVNSSWLGDTIRQNHHINIGMAVAIDQGLIVPVIRNADMKTLSQISAEAKELGGKAKDGTLKPEEFSGNTFTISNLGMFGVEEFTGIINPPDSCILAVGGIKESVVVEDGDFKAARLMKVTMSADHRVADGAVVAAFLKTLKELLEDPLRMII